MTLLTKLRERGLRPASEPTPIQCAHNLHLAEKEGLHFDSVITLPGLPQWCPPLIPYSHNWLEDAQRAVTISFQHLIADVWTQLLTSKRDSKEKSLYLLWDHEVPVPNRASALAWLLTSESWPMQNHRYLWREDVELFPPQTFLLPQSTPLGHAGTQPHGYARGANYWHAGSRTLNSLFMESLNRDDREDMQKIRHSFPPAYRPRASEATGYGFHTRIAYERMYSLARVWTTTLTVEADHNLGAYEIQESLWQLDVLHRLRQHVMSNVLTQPGMPTNKDNLYQQPGMWIRNWSEIGIAVRAAEADRLLWNPDSLPIQLEHGAKLSHVPLVAPKVWFGFTHFGPDYKDLDLGAARVETASEIWAREYQKYRNDALEWLFNPNDSHIAEAVADATAKRGLKLERAKRLKTQASPLKEPANAFGAIMRRVLNEEKDKL